MRAAGADAGFRRLAGRLIILVGMKPRHAPPFTFRSIRQVADAMTARAAGMMPACRPNDAASPGFCGLPRQGCFASLPTIAISRHAYHRPPSQHISPGKRALCSRISPFLYLMYVKSPPRRPLIYGRSSARPRFFERRRQRLQGHEWGTPTAQGGALADAARLSRQW